MKKIKNIYIASVWGIIILVLSTISGKELNKLPRIPIPHFDKIVHFGLYFILSLLLASGFKQMKNEFISKKYIYLSSIISILYGLLMELIQKFLCTDRSIDIYDLVANFSGILIGLILYPLISHKKIIY